MSYYISKVGMRDDRNARCNRAWEVGTLRVLYRDARDCWGVTEPNDDWYGNALGWGEGAEIFDGSVWRSLGEWRPVFEFRRVIAVERREHRSPAGSNSECLTPGVTASDLRQAAADLSAAIAALPEGLEGYLESLDEPLSRVRSTLGVEEATRCCGRGNRETGCIDCPNTAGVAGLSEKKGGQRDLDNAAAEGRGPVLGSPESSPGRPTPHRSGHEPAERSNCDSSVSGHGSGASTGQRRDEGRAVVVGATAPATAVAPPGVTGTQIAEEKN